MENGTDMKTEDEQFISYLFAIIGLFFNNVKSIKTDNKYLFFIK